MQSIKTSSELSQVLDCSIRESIALHMQTLAEQYAEPYQASLHGWFVVCEYDFDLLAPISGLTFNLAEKLQSGEVEFVDKKQDWYEVYILLNDNEGVLIYVPTAILERHQHTQISAF